MKYKNKKGNLANILTYLGLVPFVFLTLLITNDVTTFSYTYPKEEFFLISYAAIINSFISGIYFGYAISSSRSNISNKLLILSNIIALLAWLSLIVGIKSTSIIILILCYILNLIMDYFCYKNNIIEKWFFNLRLRISLIVIFCLVLSFWHIS